VTESGDETVTITEFSNGKGYFAFSQKSSGYDGTSEQRMAQSKSDEWTNGQKYQKDQMLSRFEILNHLYSIQMYGL